MVVVVETIIMLMKMMVGVLLPVAFVSVLGELKKWECCENKKRPCEGINVS